MRKRKGFFFFLFFFILSCLPYISARIHTIFNLILGSPLVFTISQCKEEILFSLFFSFLILYLCPLFFSFLERLVTSLYAIFFYFIIRPRSFSWLCVPLYNSPSLIYIYIYFYQSRIFFFNLPLTSFLTLPFFSLDLVFSVSPINTEGIALIIYPQILLCSTVAIKFIYLFINKISGRMSIIIQ